MVQITPGSGDNFYCENCLRDAALVKAMRAEGHDVLMVPLYLPLQTDKTEPLSNAPIFFGGINVYLQQKLSVFRKTPRWIDRMFDSPRLLEWAGRKAGMTNARDLGETTISMLEGEHGRQVKELDRFVDWLQSESDKTDVVCLSNILLGGLARRIKDRLGVPVLCLLQDEDGFLDGLTSPYAERAWEVVRRCARDVDGFVAVSSYFAEAMRQRLEVGAEKIHVVRMGVKTGDYAPSETGPAVPTIGFLSRMCPERGLETLVDAFILLKKDESLKATRLHISGGRSEADEPFIAQMQRKMADAGVLEDVEFFKPFGLDAKLDFLRGVSVLAVPEPKPVAYGLYVLEALAMGVPVVEPAIGSFPETLELTGGGVLYEPNTAKRLAEVLCPLLADPQAARQLGDDGRAGLLRAFDITQTATAMARVCQTVIETSERAGT
jgi:glycosyltransferase involved in cell wall biosynthesis